MTADIAGPVTAGPPAPAPARRRVVGRLWWLPALASVGVTAVLAWAAWQRPDWAVGLADPDQWWQPAPDDARFAVAFVIAWVATLAAYWRPRRRRPVALALVVIGGLAGLAITLGFASYARCAGGQVPALGPLTWSLLLFVGGVEPGNIGPAAVVPGCGGEFPLAFQMARFLGITATFITAIAAGLAVSRQQLDRLVVRFAADVDVVTGLDPTVVPLVKALVEEREQGRRRPDWYDSRAWDRLRRPGRPRVVLIHNNRTDPLLGEVRAVGARVLIADPAAPETVRLALRRHSFLRWVLRRPPHLSLRRLFAVSADQQANLDVLRVAEQALREILGDRAAADSDAAADAKGPRPRDRNRRGRGPRAVVRGLVPRLVVRLDDPREAHDWRVSRVGRSTDWYVDALSVDDLLARRIVDLLLECGVRQAVIAGDSPLGVAVLDEIAWRRWCHVDCADARREWEAHERMDGRDPAAGPPAPSGTIDPWPLEAVFVVGERAHRAVSEWTSHRAPCATYPTPLRVRAVRGDWEEWADRAVRAAPGRGGQSAPGSATGMAIVVVEPPSPDALARATRLARVHPAALVVAPDPAMSGVSEPPAAPVGGGGRAVARYGPTLLQGTGVPEDSWTALARQQHRWYQVRYPSTEPVATRRDWGEPGDPPKDRLPEFVREDNLQQMRMVLEAFARLGWSWEPVSRRTAPPRVSQSVAEAVAREEHERWCAIRRENGWRRPSAEDLNRLSKVELERARLNKNLRAWTDDGTERLRADNVEGVRRIITRLWYWGVEPARGARTP